MPRHYSSPRWHRHRRAIRSKARQAYREGKPLTARQTKALVVHHATTVEQARQLSRLHRRPMGRGGRRQPWKEDGHEYKLWRGSWSPSLRADPSQRPWHKQDAQETFHFPAYTSMQPPQDRAGQVSTAANDAQAGSAHGVQALLNPARKAEQRLQKLRAARAKVEAQFGMFLQGLKKSFQKELTRFQNDTARIDQSIQEAAQDQERSFAIVRSAICGTAPTVPTDQQEAAINGMWDQMRMTWEQEDGSLLQEIMRRGIPQAGPTPLPAPRQLSVEAQRLLAHHGAAGLPPQMAPPSTAAATSSTAPAGSQPAMALSPDLMQLLSHFGATGMPLPPPAGAEQPTQTHGQAPGGIPPGFHMGGLDPALFGPCSGIPSEATLGGEARTSSSISPGAKARKALATPAQPRKPIKTLTKPTSATPGQQNLSDKLEKMRESAAIREAMAKAGMLVTSETGAPPGLGAHPTPAAPTGEHPSTAGALGSSEALRPFGRPVSLRPPGDGHGDNNAGTEEVRHVEIQEGTEDEMDETTGDGQ